MKPNADIHVRHCSHLYNETHAFKFRNVSFEHKNNASATFVITVSADDLTPGGARPSADTVPTAIFFLWTSSESHLSPDDVIQNGRRNIT